MKTLNEIVMQYLEMKTKYAIIISGSWGSGKTFYYHTVLKNIISKTNLESTSTKNYKPISISLFGINSLEEIQTQIILELFPISKNKKVKLGASIAKAFVKGLMKMNGLNDYYDIVADVDIDKKDWINFEELVLVFDDLERISKKLEIEEVIGFINSLVENQNFKVIIIANEDKIKSKDYFKIKEKVIGNSIEFIPNLSETFDGIITVFNGFPKYKTFLKTHKFLILEIFENGSNNLRTLAFWMTYFHKIFSEFNTDVDIPKAFKSNMEQAILELLKFSLTVTIEYKLGKISFKNKKKLDSFIVTNRVRKLFKNNLKEAEVKTYAEMFSDKYYPKDDFKFYNSVYNYITGGDVLNFQDLKDEMYNFYGIQNHLPQPHFQLLQELNYRNCFTLSDIEYITKTKKLVENLKKGLYPLSEYLSIFHFATRFANPVKFNLQTLTNEFIKSAKKSSEPYNPTLSMLLNISSEAENPKYLKQIREVCLNINDEANLKKEKDEAVILENLYYKDVDEFCIEIFQNFKHKPIFEKFDFEKFFNFYCTSSNATKYKIFELFSLRYHQQTGLVKEEENFIRSFDKNLNTFLIKNNEKSLSHFLAHDLRRIFNQYLKKMEKHYN